MKSNNNFKNDDEDFFDTANKIILNRFTYSSSKKIDNFLIPYIEFWEISQCPDESEKYEELILLAFFLHLRTSPCGLVASVLTPRYTNSTPNLVHQLPWSHQYFSTPYLVQQLL